MLGLLATLAAADVPPPTEGAPSPEALVHPLALSETDIAYPEGALQDTEVIRVVVSILVDAQGEVAEVRLVRGVDGPFNEAVLVGATHFHFEPAT